MDDFMICLIENTITLSFFPIHSHSSFRAFCAANIQLPPIVIIKRFRCVRVFFFLEWAFLCEIIPSEVLQNKLHSFIS